MKVCIAHGVFEDEVGSKCHICNNDLDELV